jgi:glycosyltransferase involved in cell wall biosynthesis
LKIQILTDGWFPQTTGVVTTLHNLKKECEKRGHLVDVIHPHRFKKMFPLPTYSEIELAADVWNVGKMIREFGPDAIHIATPEGPIGVGGKLYCDRHGLRYTSSYWSKMPEMIRPRFPIPLTISYAYMRWVHKRSKSIHVYSESMREELHAHGFTDFAVWGGGVDRQIFNPGMRKDLRFKKPISVYVGRLAVEKEIDRFLEMGLPGTQVVVGDGPDRRRLEKRFPGAVFFGYQYDKALGECYASADVFVFPSRTDTFGMVILESISCGTPVAAFDVTGPRDIIINGVNGYLCKDLCKCAERCLTLDRKTVYESSLKWTWERCADIFLSNLYPMKHVRG